MAKKNTAHRPSQSHMEYVTTRDGRKVKNTAYSPQKKSQKSSSPVSTVLPTQAPRTLTNEEKYGDVDDRVNLAQSGKHLDDLITDENWRVRKVVANKGYSLDQLISDPNGEVRSAVAAQGYGHSRLGKDPDWQVRRSVAWYTTDPLRFRNDPEDFVRSQVVRRIAIDHIETDMDDFVNDESAVVREEVAEFFPEYHERLAYDSDSDVRQMVAHKSNDITVLSSLLDDEEYWVSKEAHDRHRDMMNDPSYDPSLYE